MCDGVTYEVVSVLAMGMEKIVYELKNVDVGVISHVIRVYRERKSNEQALQIETKYHDLRKALGEVVLETHYVSIDGWLAEIQRHLSPPGSDILLFDSHVGRFFSKLSSDKPDVKRITELYVARNFEGALAECERKLDEFPLSPDYLAIKGGALLGLNRTDEALSTLELCIEIEPNEARHYFNLAIAEDQAGHLAFARALAYQASILAKDTPEIWSFLFDLEVFLGHIDAAAHILERLSGYSLSPTHLRKLRERLDARAEEINGIEQDMKRAWELYNKDELESAVQIADSISENAPYVDALFLSGIIAIAREQWDKAIMVLGRAQGLDLENQDVTFYSGYAHLMNNDLEASSACHLFWLRTFLDASNHVLELVRTSEEGSGDEIIVERESDICLVRNSDRIKERCSTLRRAYGSVCSPIESQNIKIVEIMKGLETLTSSMEQLGL